MLYLSNSFFFFLNKYTDVGKIRKFVYILYVVIREKIVLFRGCVDSFREPMKANVPIIENTQFYKSTHSFLFFYE